MVAVVTAAAEEEEEGSPWACACAFFSLGSATDTADCDMQPMEKGKTAKRSPPPELPRRSFIYGPLLAGVTRTETHRRCTRVGNPAASVLSSPSYLIWLLLAGRCRWMDGWVGPPVRRPVRAFVFLALLPRMHD